MTTIETHPTTNTVRVATSQANASATSSASNLVPPVLFVVDHDPNSLEVLLSDLSRRFGNDFTVRGETSPAAALAVLQEMRAGGEPVACSLSTTLTLTSLQVRTRANGPVTAG